jgi:hypothetical protein
VAALDAERAAGRAEARKEWEDILTDANVINWTLRAEHEGNPRLALTDLLRACADAWHNDHKRAEMEEEQRDRAEQAERERDAMRDRAEQAERERDAMAAAMPSEGADAALAYAVERSRADKLARLAEKLDAALRAIAWEAESNVGAAARLAMDAWPLLDISWKQLHEGPI